MTENRRFGSSLNELERHLDPRDVVPGDYVYVRTYIKEDNTCPMFSIAKVFGSCESHMIVKEGSGYTKYAWSEVFPIRLTETNIERFNMVMLNDPSDDYRIYGYKLVTIDPTYASRSNTTSRFYFNDGDYRDVHFMHEAQHLAYKMSNNTFDFDLKPVFPNMTYRYIVDLPQEDDGDVFFE